MYLSTDQKCPILIKIELPNIIYQEIHQGLNNLCEIDSKLQFLIERSNEQFVKITTQKKEIETRSMVISPNIIPISQDAPVSWVGVQRHLSKAMNNEYDLNAKIIFLNQLKTDITSVELAMRGCNRIVLGLNTLKSCENASESSFPNGIFTEEACQLARYAGISNSVNTLIINEFNINAPSSIVLQIITELIWYFMEGFVNRINEDFTIPSDFQTMIIEHDLLTESIIVLKGRKSGRLWLKTSENNPQFIPCSSNEVLELKAGTIPNRLLTLFA